MKTHHLFYLLAVIGLLAGACSSDDSAASTTAAPAATTAAPAPAVTTEPPATTEAGHDDGPNRQVNAPAVAITVDGDVSDWAGVDGLDMTLEPIQGEGVDTHPATVKAAHDDEFLYLLVSVDDDYNWNADDGHLSSALGVMWSIDTEAGPHMGTDAEDGEGPSMGMVDIWHWELECGLGVESGGAVADAGEGADLGNDSGCNFDDEWSTDPKTREDDNAAGAENSLLGVFSHSNPVDDGAGTWSFEMRRPLQTGDSTDAQFAAGETARLALAYWDSDNSVEGWDDDEHVQSSNQGWIDVLLAQ